jgi:hypothetical protein
MRAAHSNEIREVRPLCDVAALGEALGSEGHGSPPPDQWLTPRSPFHGPGSVYRQKVDGRRVRKVGDGHNEARRWRIL